MFIFVLVAVFSIVLSVSAQQNDSSDRTSESIPTPVPSISEEATADDLQVVEKRATPTERRDSISLWTSETIDNAPAIAFPEYPDTGSEALIETIIGEFGSTESVQPALTADSDAAIQFPEGWAESNLDESALAVTELQAPTGTSATYTGYAVNSFTAMHKAFPFRAMGRLTFRTSSTSTSSCTATVISPHVIVTAAHCVYDTGSNRFYSNFAFTPAWRNGSGPYGTFYYTNARVLSGWINASSAVRRYDVAVIKLANNSYGRSVSYYTGSLGRSWNYGYTQNIHAFGYPSNLGSGKYTYACTAETFSGGTDVLGMGCNMTYGSSGGPWLRVYAPFSGSSSSNSITGVVSGGTPGTNTFYGPRFSSNNIVPLCNLSAGWSCSS